MTNQPLTPEARQAREEYGQIIAALNLAQRLARRLADDYGLDYGHEEGLLPMIAEAIGQAQSDSGYLVEMVQCMTEEAEKFASAVQDVSGISEAFNQWSNHLVARVKSEMTHSDLPIIFSYCRDCGKGLGAVNGNRIGHCADAGEPCQVPAVPRVGQP
jgi:hypothetical protein